MEYNSKKFLYRPERYREREKRERESTRRNYRDQSPTEGTSKGWFHGPARKTFIETKISRVLPQPMDRGAICHGTNRRLDLARAGFTHSSRPIAPRRVPSARSILEPDFGEPRTSPGISRRRVTIRYRGIFQPANSTKPAEKKNRPGAEINRGEGGGTGNKKRGGLDGSIGLIVNSRCVRLFSEFSGPVNECRVHC